MERENHCEFKYIHSLSPEIDVFLVVVQKGNLVYTSK